jgi:hypothetical protein
MTKRLARLATIAYVLFLLVFVELSLQGFYRVTAGAWLSARVDVPRYVPNLYSTFWNKPDMAMAHNTNEFRVMVHTNSQGFRTSAAHEEYALDKDPRMVRVMLFGPSFAFGWAVNHEDTFLVRLRDLLRADGFGAGRAIETINTGVPALGAEAHLRWYEAVGRHYHPDLAIQLIYGSMDVTEKDPQTVNPEGYLVPRRPDAWRRVVAIAKQSAIVFYGWVVVTRLRSAFDRGKQVSEIQGAGRSITEHDVFDPRAPELQPSLRFYARLREVVQGGGGRLLIVYVPLSYTVHPEDVARWQHLGVRNVQGQMRFDDDFCKYLTRTGLPCLNVTADLVRAAQESTERLYYWLDIHWTPKGNRVSAESVARYLRQHPELSRAPG